MRPIRKTSYVNTRALNQNIFWLLMFMVALCASAYIFFINSAIIQIVHRNKLESQIRTLRTELITLESDYYGKTNSLTPDDALNLGFIIIPDREAQFVAVGTDGKILTYRGAR